MALQRAPARLIVIAALAAVALTAGCRGTGEPRDAAAGFMAQNDGYGLHFVDSGETAKLAYGRPDSEMMSLMLECAKGSGEVEISDVAQGAGEIVLASDGDRESFDGAVAVAPIAPILVAGAKADAPVLKAFRRTGRVEVANGKQHYAVSGAKPMVEAFFAACETTA